MVGDADFYLFLAVDGCLDHVDNLGGPIAGVGDSAHLGIAATEDAAFGVAGGIAGMDADTLVGGCIHDEGQHLPEARGIGDDDLVDASGDGCLTFYLTSFDFLQGHGCGESAILIFDGFADTLAVDVKDTDGIAWFAIFAV